MPSGSTAAPKKAAATPSPPPPNDPAPSGDAAAAQGGPAPAAATAAKRTPRGWGEPARPEDWLKLRDLVNRHFAVVRIGEATITAKSGENAGVARPSYVFELDDGRCFSVNKTDSVGKQIGSFGTPPTPARYWVESVPSEKSQTGDALLLRPYHGQAGVEALPSA